VSAKDPSTAPVEADPAVPARPPQRRRVAVNTLIFAVATGLSRIAGLVREIVASSYFATSGAFSAFTIAFQVPNLIRTFVADQAVTAAFVPVFTELLEHDKRKEAFRLASTLFFMILAGLGAITTLFIVLAPHVMPLFTGAEFTPALDHLCSGLSRVLFPIVVLLGLNGLLVGILNAYDHFTIPAIAPLVWNMVILVVLVATKPLFSGSQELYAYAIGVLAGTVVQFAMCVPVLRRYGFKLNLAFDFRDPRLGRVFKLMLPVTIGLGLININLLVNSTLGSLVSDQAPRAIDAAFRIYMLPQGMFSVALATVLFPTLARYATRKDFAGMRATVANGLRQILLMLIPAAAFMCVLAVPIVRLIYQHGEFGAHSTDQVSEALFWFSFSLPLNGVNLLMTRSFFSLQRPWLPTALSTGNIALNIAVSAALYGPFGIAGIVIGTFAGNVAMVTGQSIYLRRELSGLEARATLEAVTKMAVAAAVMCGLAYLCWWGLDRELGRSIEGQVVSVGAATVLAGVVYGVLVTMLRVREADQIRHLVMGRLRRARPA
jgi:putative peptidoglycan lipid II flippase